MVIPSANYGSVESKTAALAKFGKANAFLDISSPEAAEITHIKSAILSLRNGGRVI